MTNEEEKQLEKNQMVGVEVNLEKFEPKYKLGDSYYIPHEERQESLEDKTDIKSQLREEETLDWHPDDSLYIPLRKDEEIIGQISVDDPENSLVPDPERLQPIESFASLASLGIEKTCRAEELEKRKSHLEALHELTEELREQEDIETFCKSIADKAQQILKFDKVLIFLREGDKLVPKCTFPPKMIEEIEPREIEKSFGGSTVREGEPMWGNLDQFQSNHPHYQQEGGSIIILPLGEIGSIQLISDKEGAFDEEDLKFVQIFADRLRGELERFKLEEKLREKEL